MGGHPPNPEFIYKSLCIYSYTFKLQSLSKHSPFDTIHLSRHFFYCSKQFLSLLILMPFSASLIFCFISSTLAKRFSLGLFSSGETHKNILLGVRFGEYGGWGMGVMPFLVKNCWTLSIVWAGALVNHPSWNGQMLSPQKKFTGNFQPRWRCR